MCVTAAETVSWKVVPRPGNFRWWSAEPYKAELILSIVSGCPNSHTLSLPSALQHPHYQHSRQPCRQLPPLSPRLSIAIDPLSPTHPLRQHLHGDQPDHGRGEVLRRRVVDRGGGVGGRAVRRGRGSALAHHQGLTDEDERFQRRQVRDVRVLAERGVDALEQVGRRHPVRVTLRNTGRYREAVRS